MNTMQVEALEKLINEAVALRPVNADKLAEYAERMEAGTKFPPVIVGSWPLSEKYGQGGVVDGMHRIGAAKVAGVKTLDVEERKFDTLQSALKFMYDANMAHGLPVTEGQRNARIKLLRKIDPSLTLEKIGKEFGLGKSSIDRIVKDDQGEGKSGRKTGTSKSKAHKSQEVLKPKAIVSALERLDYTFARVKPTADFVAHCSPEEDGKDGESRAVIDKDKVALLKKCITHLSNIVKELS